MQWIDFAPLAEFVDRSGATRSIYGCSLIGRFEFADRLQQLQSILDEHPDSTLDRLYQEHRQFRQAIDRVLMLNGIDPEWVTMPMIEQLLFVDSDGGDGCLVGLNAPPSPSDGGDGGAATLPDLLAALSLNCESLSEAIDLATKMPANLLLDTIESKRRLLKTPEQKEEETKRERLKELRRMF
jgi:hypothetical protein